VLLVANHPNSLIDPILVCAAARRPVRFLAKAPLFSDFKTAWMMRAVGAIPVYRRVDDPALMDRNTDTFRAVYATLARGAAVGIFPEGQSHSEPSMVTLKTGAARIVLGTHAAHGTRVPIVPMGLVFRQKDIFRSDALIVVGSAVPWDDLADRGTEDPDAVRDLTERIGAGLRQVPDPRWDELVRAVRAHRRRLARLRLSPRWLGARADLATSVRWAVRRYVLVMPMALLLALAGLLLFLAPYWLTGKLVDRLRLDVDERSTWKLLLGGAVYGAWLLLLAVVAGFSQGPSAVLAVLLVVPVVGMAGLVIRERWRGAWIDARRFFLLRSRQDLVATLRDRQRELAERFKLLYQERSLV
jgi:1-acyl-sn-glycerol-3-phosphate acyltransferase